MRIILASQHPGQAITDIPDLVQTALAGDNPSRGVDLGAQIATV